MLLIYGQVILGGFKHPSKLLCLTASSSCGSAQTNSDSRENHALIICSLTHKEVCVFPFSPQRLFLGNLSPFIIIFSDLVNPLTIGMA